MKVFQIICYFSIIVFFAGCESSNTRDFNVVDSSVKFTNVEFSKKIGERLQVQFGANGSTISGSSYSPALSIHPTVRADTGNTSPFARAQNEGSIRTGGFEYEAPNMSYDYSARHSALSIGYDVIHGKKFGLMISGGISDYNYSVIATMQGNVNRYGFVYDVTTLSEGKNVKTLVDNSYFGPAETVTDKQFFFKYSAVGLYISAEPRYQFDRYFGVSARVASSFAKNNSNYLAVTASELDARFIYTPLEHLQTYIGYQAWSIGNDLDSTVDQNNPADVHLGHANLTLDLRGFVGGVALRF